MDTYIEKLYDRAMQETPHNDVEQLFSSHFVQGRGYRAWRPKGTKDWLLTYTMAGRGRFGYAGGEMVATAGDVVCIAPHTMHDYGVEYGLEHWEFVWVHFHARPHWVPYLRFCEVSPGLFHLRVGPKTRDLVRGRFFEVSEFLASALKRREDFAMNALERTLLLLDDINPQVQDRLDPRVVRAQAFLRQNLTQRVRLVDVAKACHLSSSRLSHLFRDQVGVTPIEFLNRERLDRAKGLLKLSSLNIQSVAAEVGFDSPFYFARRFKLHTGLTPSAYRRQSSP